MTNHDQMTLIDTPKAADILCGKDKTFGKHPGNMLYRDLIEAKALDYANAVYKLDKMKLTTEIVDTMVSEFGSRFLRPVGPSTVVSNVDGSVRSVSGWEEISLTAARDKTSHALRFCATHSISTRSLAKMDVSSPPTDNAEVTVSPSVTGQVGTAGEGDHSRNDLSRIDEIIQLRLKQIEREKEQQMLLLMNNTDDSPGKAPTGKFKKLPIVKPSPSKKPKVVRSPRKHKALSPTAPRDESAMNISNAAAPPPVDQAQKHYFTLSPSPQLPPPPLPQPMHFFHSEPLFPRTVSTDMIVLATAAAAVEAAEARAAAAQEVARLAANCANGGH
jgi:hypothetical protein